MKDLEKIKLEFMRAMKFRETEDGSKFVILAGQNPPYPSPLVYHVLDAKTLKYISMECDTETVVSKYGKLKEVAE